MKLAELERLPLKDLKALRGRIDEAIRAAIAKSRPVVVAAQPAGDAPKLDLEREREAWEARKKADEIAFNVAAANLQAR